MGILVILAASTVGIILGVVVGIVLGNSDTENRLHQCMDHLYNVTDVFGHPNLDLVSEKQKKSALDEAHKFLAKHDNRGFK